MWDLVNDILILFPIIFNLIIGLFIFFKNFKKRENVVFFLITLLFSLWSVSLYLYKYPVFFDNLFWIKISYSIISILMVLVALLNFIFPADAGFRKKQIVKIYSFFYLVYSAYYFWQTDKMLATFGGRSTEGVEFGPFYIIWIFLTFGMILQVFWNYLVSRKNCSDVTKIKMRYVFYGFGIWSILVSIFSILVPLYFGFSNNFSLMAAPSLIFSGIIAYTIINNRLMDLKLFTTKMVSYVLLTSFIVVFYSVILELFNRFIFPLAMGEDQFFMSLLLVVTTAYILPVLKDFFEKFSENILYKEKYVLNELLGEISLILGTEIVLSKLSYKVIKKIVNTLNLDFGFLWLYDGKRLILIEKIGEIEKLENINQIEFEQIFNKVKLIQTYDNLRGGNKKKFMDGNSLGCVIRLEANEKKIGYLVLGRRRNGEIFSVEDLKILEILTPQLSIAIHNSQQYEEIQSFSHKLEKRVLEATGKLRVVNRRLKELDKLKDEFVSVAAHELRAPLTAIRGYLSMVLEGDAGKVSRKLNKFLDGALEGTEREVRLVNNMLNVSRIEEGRLIFKMEKIDLSKVVESSFEEYKFDVLGKKLKYTLNIKKGLKPWVYVDKDRIHEVVVNLISNAIKYTDKGSIQINLLNIGNKIKFEIEDSGYGINKEDQNKLFQKFYRTESSGGKSLGTGLGLYICRLLIEKFDGGIGIESEVGKGSVFWFELPLR